MPTAMPTSRPTSVPTSTPTVQPTVGKKNGGSGAGESLGPASIAGIVISVAAFVGFIGFYVYRTHYQYLRRFIKLNFPGGYHLIKDPDGDGDYALHASGKSRNMAGEETDGLDLEQSVSNPILRSDSNQDSIRGRGNSDVDGETQAVSSLGITKAGYLLKQTTSMQRNWVRRWFFIKDGYLYYSRKHIETAEGNDSPRAHDGKIINAVLVSNLMISTIKVVTSTEFHIVSPGTRGIGTGGGVYCLQAESDADGEEWIRVIKSQIETYLSRSLPVLERSPSPFSSSATAMSPAGSGAAAGAEKNVFYENKLVYTSTFFVPSEAILQRLYQANAYCADCHKAHPEWASINLCVMICIDCAGVHRKLGAHISKVRSLKLDKWSQNLADLLVTIGNEHSNALWMSGETAEKDVASLPPREREEYIRAKYEHRSFVSPLADRMEAQYSFLLAAREGDCLGVMKGLVHGVDVNFVLSLLPPTESGESTEGAEAEVGERSSLGESGKALLTFSTPTLIPVNTIHSLAAGGSSLVASPSQHVDSSEHHEQVLRKILCDGRGEREEMVGGVLGQMLDMTALMLACQHGHVLCVELLLLWQANLQYRNTQGLTARDVITLEEPARSEITNILTNSYEAKQY